MKPVPFDYYRPGTLAEAADVLAALREDAAVLAGGLSLGPMLNLRLARPRAIVDITRIPGADGIEVRGGTVTTGALLTQADALASPEIAREVPLLRLALPWLGHFQTRNRGTVGGSVAHADPSAEIPLCLVTLDGTVVLRSRRRERRIAAREFFVGALATARAPDELVVALEWPRAPADAGHAFEEVAQRRGDFAIAAAACRVRLTPDGRIAEAAVGIGGVEPRPICVDTRPLLDCPAGNADAIADFAALTVKSLAPMEDHVARAEYRRALAQALIARVLKTAIASARKHSEGGG
ncbi:MAG TPA: FAD binding domain-containing protein [Burkholderiales bacterium]